MYWRLDICLIIISPCETMHWIASWISRIFLLATNIHYLAFENTKNPTMKNVDFVRILRSAYDMDMKCIALHTEYTKVKYVWKPVVFGCCLGFDVALVFVNIVCLRPWQQSLATPVVRLTIRNTFRHPSSIRASSLVRHLLIWRCQCRRLCVHSHGVTLWSECNMKGPNGKTT